MAEIEFPDKLAFLLDPARYKVAHGGRGSGKSWAFARALILQSVQGCLRILCTREVQRSIKDSVHRLLVDQIQVMGLGQFFDVTEVAIRGRNGSEFLFAGLASHTVESIKSYEGIDRVWVEEAQTVSKKSWDILLPTIRKPGSEIWVSLNPGMDTDDTYQRFVASPPPGAVVAQINWNDNPWFPAELEAERLHCLANRPDDYQNIWEGKCKAVVDGAIYHREVADAIAAGRVRDVPYDPMLKAHLVWDLGWNDAMSVAIVQRAASELRFVHYIEDSHRTLDSYSAELKALNYNWGRLWLPHDGRHRDFKTGKSAEDIMRALGWSVSIIPRVGIEDGIRQTRMDFRRAYFDKTKCARLIECAKRYRRGIPATTGEPGAPIHDEFSHGADVLRYVFAVADQMQNEEWGGGALPYRRLGTV